MNIKRESVGGLAGIGGPVGMYGNVFVSQLQSPTFLRPKYAIQDDILTNNIVTTDKTGKLRKISSKYLDDKRIAMFKYTGKDPNAAMMRVLESLDSYVDRDFIYEAITGKQMLTDDQILYDAAFEEVNFEKIRSDIENEAYTYINKFTHYITPEKLKDLKIINTQESVNLLKDKSDDLVVVFNEDIGYYVENRKTLARTKYYSSIEDIRNGDGLYI